MSLEAAPMLLAYNSLEGWGHLSKRYSLIWCFDRGGGEHCITEQSKVSQRGSALQIINIFSEMPLKDVSELCLTINSIFFLKCMCYFSVCLPFTLIMLWIQVVMFNATSISVDSSFTVSLHGNRNSSKSQITLHMMWVYKHPTIYMQCFTLRVGKSLIMSKEVLCQEPYHLAISICKIETSFNWYTSN